MADTNFTPPVRVLREPDARETNFSGPVKVGGDDIASVSTQVRSHPNGTGHIYGPDDATGPGTTFRGRLVVAGTELLRSSPSITTTTFADGADTVAYSEALVADPELGTPAATAWTVDAGSLPSGLSIDDASAATTVISGTPDTVEEQTFTLKYENADGGFATREFTINITA